MITKKFLYKLNPGDLIKVRRVTDQLKIIGTIYKIEKFDNDIFMLYLIPEKTIGTFPSDTLYIIEKLK